MPYAIERFDSLGYVVVRHHGHVALDEIDQIYTAIHESNAGGVLPGLIVDLKNCDSYPTQAELFGALDTFHHRPPGARKTAFVAAREFLDQIRFVELASENRGIPVKAFTDEAAALEWLGVGPN